MTDTTSPVRANFEHFVQITQKNVWLSLEIIVHQYSAVWPG